MTFEDLRATLGRLRISRFELCHKIGLSRFRFFQAERGAIKLTDLEWNAIKSFLTKLDNINNLNEICKSTKTKSNKLGVSMK